MTGVGSGGISVVPGASQGGIPQWFGAYYGVVSSNADPLKKNRAMLRVPQVLGTTATSWAWALTPLSAPPAVGTVVMALFAGGDVSQPAYHVVTQAALALSTTTGDIQSVGLTASAGTSKTASASNHVHPITGVVETNAANVGPLASGPAGSGTVGTSGKLSYSDHSHPATGAAGFLEISSGQATTGDLAATVDMYSNLEGGQTTISLNAAVTALTGLLNVGGSGVSVFNGQIQAPQFNLNPPMAAPPNWPLSNDPSSGSAWTTGERGYINAIVACLNQLISSMIARGLIS